MKNAVFLLLTAACLYATQARAQGMEFHKGTWEEVLADAKAQNRPIFIDAYAVWCGPCKYMAAEVFTKEEVGAFMNKNFINYKLDVEQKGDGAAFSEKYGVKLLPTLFYFAPDGTLLHKTVGGASAEAFLKGSKEALAEDTQLYTQQKHYDGGKRDKEFLKKFLLMLSNAAEETSAKTVFETFWGSLNDEERLAEDVFQWIAAYGSSPKSKIYEYVSGRRDKYKGIVGDALFDSYLENVVQAGINEAIAAGSIKDEKKDLPKLVKEMQKVNPAQADYIKSQTHFLYYANAVEANPAKLTAFMKAQDDFLSKHCREWSWGNAMAWDVVESENKKQYKSALKWINRSVGISKNFYNLDTKAWLLYRMGKNKEALATAKEAIAIAKEAGEDSSGTEELLKLIEK